jgi:hypothetical protein
MWVRIAAREEDSLVAAWVQVSFSYWSADLHLVLLHGLCSDLAI